MALCRLRVALQNVANNFQQIIFVYNCKNRGMKGLGGSKVIFSWLFVLSPWPGQLWADAPTKRWLD